MIFIDWANVFQRALPGTLPVVGSEHKVTYDIVTGERIKEVVMGFRHEGSYDTSVRVRSDASCYSCEGNPSAFARPDNLWGHQDIHQALGVYDDILADFGLPLFTSTPDRPGELMPEGSRIRYVPAQGAMPGRFVEETLGRQAARTDTLLDDCRARLFRIDLTQNLETNGAVDFIRHLSTYRHQGHAGHLHENGRTVSWGGRSETGKGSRRINNKYYDKAFSIGLRIIELEKIQKRFPSIQLALHIEYLKDLKSYCEKVGMVRHELSLKSTELIDRNLIRIESWDQITMTNVITPYQFHKKINVTETTFTGIAERLISMNLNYAGRLLTLATASKAEMLHTSWVNGGDVRKLAGSYETFQRYRKLLLNVGVDISVPCDISRITLRAHKATYQEAKPPSWYVMPASKGGNNVNQLAA